MCCIIILSEPCVLDIKGKQPSDFSSFNKIKFNYYLLWKQCCIPFSENNNLQEYVDRLFLFDKNVTSLIKVNIEYG